MKKLMVAALLGCAAMPAQAFTYITYEGWGTITGTYNGQDVGSPAVSGTYTGDVYVSVTFIANEGACQSPMVMCGLAASSATFREISAAVAPDFVSFGFGVPTNGAYPTAFDAITSGYLSTNAAGSSILPPISNISAPGSGALTRFKVTTFNSDIRTQTSLSVSVTQAVPEPATWAMMIGGFALAGAALRGRYRSSAKLSRASSY